MPAPGSMGTAYLAVRTSSGSETFYLPPITSIDSQIYASLSELPTVVLGYQNNFCIDLGTYQKISLTMKRDNPASYNDNQESNPDLWSNGKWYRHLEGLMNFWQNFGLDPRLGTKTGGFIFDFTPSDTTLYRPIHKNVFLNGSLSLQYSTTYMVVQMNLTVARMAGGSSSSGSTVTITMHSRTPSGSNFNTISSTVAQGILQQIPRVPADWEQEWNSVGYTFQGWDTSPSATNVVYEAYEPITLNNDIDLYAVWSSNIVHVEVFPAGRQYTVPSGLGISRVDVIAVGGGGGAGGSGSGARGTAGGGGGAGEVRYGTGYGITAGEVISVTIGGGGAHGDNGSEWTPDYGGDGADGVTTTVTVPGQATPVTARGGQGGKGGRPYNNGGYASGGQLYYPGGGSQLGSNGEDGQTGSTDEDDWGVTTGDPGRGFVSDSTLYGCGAGGGASDFCINYNLSTGTYRYHSKGGDGGGYLSDGTQMIHATTPEYGGGGGSDPWGTATSGANGFVVLLFYRGD